MGLEYDYGTGDRDASDGTWTRFDSLFGNRRVDLGPTSIYGALGRENIATAGIRLSVAPSRRLDAFGVYRVLGLAAAADAFSSTGVRDPSGASGRRAGGQWDLRMRYLFPDETLRVEAGVTRLVIRR